MMEYLVQILDEQTKYDLIDRLQYIQSVTFKETLDVDQQLMIVEFLDMSEHQWLISMDDMADLIPCFKERNIDIEQIRDFNFY